MQVSKKDLLAAIQEAAPAPRVDDVRWEICSDHYGDPIVRVWVIFDTKEFHQAYKTVEKDEVSMRLAVSAPAKEAARSLFKKWLPSRYPHVGIRTSKEQDEIDKSAEYATHDHEFLEPDEDVVREIMLDDHESRINLLEERLDRLERSCGVAKEAE